MVSSDHPNNAGISRRNILMSAAGLVALAGCGSTIGGSGNRPPAPSARSTGAAHRPTASGKLVLYNYAQYVNPKTYKAFAAEYPHVDVVKAYYASEEEVSAKLRAGGTSQYDNIVVAGTTAAQLYAEGLLRPIDKSLLPNLANVDPALIHQKYDPNATFSVPKNYGITGFGYDSGAVHDPPHTWAEFYDKLKEYAPATSLLEGATAVVGSALQAVGSNLGESDDKVIAEALALLKAKKKYIGHVSTANFYTLFGKGGPVVLGQAWNGDVLRVRADRPSMEFVIPSGQADAWTGVWAIPAHAPNPEASHAWINTLLEPANAANEMKWSLFPVSVPQAAKKLQATDKEFRVPWITASTKDLARMATPLLSPEVLRKYNDAYTQFQAS